MIRLQIKNIYKKFHTHFQKKQGFLAQIIVWLGRENQKEITILDDVSFTVTSGEVLGIIGKNGSGKSTLLRIIAGIYRPDEGEITVRGKIISIINLDAGFKDRLTMEENIFLVGSLFGMSQREIKHRFPSIVAFSELQEFVGTKMYQFSSGMFQRLAFSIAIHAQPEILLLDEVFELGDESFRKKSREKIQEFVRDGVSVIFVTHDLDMLAKQCHRVIWLDGGKIKMQGTPSAVLNSYYA